MKIAIPTETQAGESRVAASPDTVKAYIRKGAEVSVQAGAGVVADSIPELEDAECWNKARALLAAVEPARRMRARRPVSADSVNGG